MQEADGWNEQRGASDESDTADTGIRGQDAHLVLRLSIDR
ncbi:MAG: hypothetical protein NVS9B15_25100 [Acidobacteriaceae bacterium]